ncbi:MAG: glycosyltransferase [Acidiphilium sp.]|nr:glycosyltransferase [Acidiphilium sp.]
MNPPLDDTTFERVATGSDTAEAPSGASPPPPASIVIFLPSLTIGGAEISRIRLAGAFAATGDRVAVVVQTSVTGETIPLPPEVELIVLGIRRTWASPFALARFAVAWGADVMIAALPHNNLAAIFAGRIAHLRYRRHLRVVVTEHAPIGALIAANRGFRYRILPLMQRWLYPMADAVVCASSGIATEFRATLPVRTPIHTIFNPIVSKVLSSAEPTPPPEPDPAQSVLIVAAGRLAPEKDFATLLRAFALLRAQIPARLIIAGEGTERPRLMALAAALGITSDVEMPGFVTDLPALLARADVFVSTSRFEGFGNVIAEALACGTRIVATDCPVGPREILAGGAFGTLVPVGDAPAIAAAISHALDHDHDRAALRHRAADFTVGASMAAYRAVITPAGRPLSLAIYMHDFSSGGVEHAVLSLIGAFRAGGIDVTLLVHSEAGELRGRLPPDLPVINFATGRTIADLPPLIRYLRRNRPDILLANLDHNNLIATLASLIARTGTRLVIVQHNALSAEASAMPSLKYRLLPLAYRILAPRAAGIVAVSAGVADDLAHCAGLDRAAISVINNPVVDDSFVFRTAAPAEHPWISEAATIPLFVTAGRLVAQKDPETLIRAFAIARARHPMRLIMLGEGPMRPRLEALIAEYGLADAVQMPGYVANPLPWFAAATGFVLASRYEGFGNVLVEAMACGTPVISTNCPHGPAEILDNGTYGTLVPPGDIEALAEALDPDLRQHWPAAALRARADHYTLAASACCYRSLFARLMDRRAVS